ncbi:transcriptional regulator [Clostridium baratii]|uniref:transcriptional regulator n=1 Tax=Clostridium baratii TaxID=1561 RepID=UPI0030CC8ACF
MNKRYYYVKDIMDMLDVKETKAYQIIKMLNSELEEKGYITVSGRISKKYFDERYYC